MSISSRSSSSSVSGASLSLTGGFLLGRKLLVERHEALVIARRLAHEDFLAGEIVQAGDLRRGRPRHHDLAHVAQAGRGEVHQFLALRRDREIGGGDVALAGGQRRQQLVAPHRDEYHPHLQVLVLEFLLGGSFLLSSSSNSRK